MFDHKEIEAKIRECEARLRMEESKYIEAVRSHKNYDTLKRIRNYIRDIKEELRAVQKI